MRELKVKCRNMLRNLCFLPLPPPFAAESYLAQIAGKPATALARWQMQPLIAKWQKQEEDSGRMTISGSVGLVFPMDLWLHVPVTSLTSTRSLHRTRPPVLCKSKSPTASGAAETRPSGRVLRGDDLLDDGSLDAAPAVPARARCSFQPGRSLQPEFAGSVRDEASWVQRDVVLHPAAKFSQSYQCREERRAGAKAANPIFAPTAVFWRLQPGLDLLQVARE